MEIPCKFKAVKVIDDTNRKIAGYATIWGEVDCQRDSMERAAIEPYVGKGTPLMLYRHGLDPYFKSHPVGVWTHLQVDDVGLYAEGKLFDNEYGQEAFKRLKSKNMAAMSVGSVWYLVQKQPQRNGTKTIKNWPLLEISIMEDNQCVPSAVGSIKSQSLFDSLSDVAVKMGLDRIPADLLDESTNAEISGEQQTPLEVKGMSIDNEALEAKIAEALARIESEKLAAAEAEALRVREVHAKAAELVETQLDSIAAQVREELADEAAEAIAQSAQKYEAEIGALKSKLHQQAQQGAPPAYNGSAPAPRIEVGSRYDRLNLFDAGLRYMVMKSNGMQTNAPSEEFYRALADKAQHFMNESITVNGRTAPSLDWNALVDSKTDLNTTKDDIMQVKGQFSGPQTDPMTDPVTDLGARQLYWMFKNQDAIKANEVTYSTQSASGDEWVPTLMSAVLWRDIRLNAAVLPLFDQFDMPSQPYDQPVESTDPVAYSVTETTNEAQLILTGGPFTDSKLGTAKVTYSAGKLGMISYWSEDMQEDSIINFEPQIQDQYGISFAHQIDEVLISGDETTGTVNISDYGGTIAAASKFLAFDGLRHEPMVTTTTDKYDVAGALSISHFLKGRSLMGSNGVYGINPRDLVYLSDGPTYFKAVGLDEVLTVDKMGSAATVLNGQLGSVFGIPLVVSQDFGLTNASGQIHDTVGNNVKGSFLTINRRGWRVGWRRRPRVSVVRLPGADARYIVISGRLDLKPLKAGMAAYAYNITVA